MCVHCEFVETDNEFVKPANSTVKLNCTLPHNGTVTWLHNKDKIESTNKDDEVEVEEGVLKVTVGEF